MLYSKCSIEVNTCCRFAVVLLYSFYTTNLVAVGQTTMDVFIVTIFYQCKTQLTIVR